MKCTDCGEEIYQTPSGFCTNNGSLTPYRCEYGTFSHHVPDSEKTPPTMNYDPLIQGGFMSSFKEAKENLKLQIEQNPVWALGAAAALLAGMSQLWDSKTKAANSRIQRMEIKRRIRNDDEYIKQMKKQKRNY